MPNSKITFAIFGATLLLASTSVSLAQDLNVVWKGVPELSSDDGNYKMKIRGRIFTDWGSISDNSGKVADTTELRTGRIGIEGVIMKDIKYKFGVDFAGGNSNIKNASIEWSLKPVSIVVGQYKVPVSLEEQTSSRYITFIERSGITDAFGFGRNIGIGANFLKNNFTIKAGVFQGTVAGNSNKEGRTYALRSTYAVKIKNALIHIGASAFHRKNDQGILTKRYRQRPHHHLSPSRYVDTGNLNAKSDTFFGAEFGVVLGPLSAQTEWGGVKSNAATRTGIDASFSGGYVDVSYIITGENRGYKGGVFDRIEVANPVSSGGAGAFQIAARYDVIDLTDKVADVFGGKQTSYIVGMNWYLNNYIRVMANYSNSKIDGGNNNGQNINTFGLRFQIDW
ncbi:porin [Emcibacteraceae bacterium]|nr:porin [Emcibacteraceae bacterium]